MDTEQLNFGIFLPINPFHSVLVLPKKTQSCFWYDYPKVNSNLLRTNPTRIFCFSTLDEKLPEQHFPFWSFFFFFSANSGKLDIASPYQTCVFSTCGEFRGLYSTSSQGLSPCRLTSCAVISYSPKQSLLLSNGWKFIAWIESMS